MSGFVAVVSQHIAPGQQAFLEQMSLDMQYRGDMEASEVFSTRCAAVARHRDNSGYAVSLYSDGEFSILIDGLVFNSAELARVVGIDPAEPIAKILLQGFRKFSDAWFARIDGSFAIMIADLRSANTIVVRDRFAHRPMYFGHAAGSTWIASEAKAIVDAPGFHRELNQEKLHSAIGYGFTPGPQTLFSGVYKCVPGFVVRIDTQGRQHSTDYFTPSIDVQSDLTLEDGKDYILDAIEKNVRHYLEACPDLNLMLSGGVDSALLAHILTDLSHAKTMAVSFGAESWSNEESADAARLAEKLGMPFEKTFVSLNDDLLGSLRQVIRVLEEPTRFENALAIEMTTRDAAGHCTAIMTGEGADFILGEREHGVVSRLSKILKIPGPLRSVARRIPLHKIPLKPLRGFAAYLDWDSMRDYGQKCSANCNALVPGATAPPHNEIVDMLADTTSNWPVQSQYTFMTLREAAHCWIERMEKLSAAAGLECFHPFESNDILKYGLEMPDGLRIANGINKPILRGLAEDMFDRELAYGEKKQLAAPMMLWLNESEQLRDAALNLRSPDSRIREYLEPSSVNHYLAAYERDGAASESVAVHIFRMLTFEIWLETFF